MAIALFERALLPDPAFHATPALCTDVISWDVPPPHGMLRGVVYTDGATFNGDDPQLARAGYGIAQLDGNFHLLTAGHGPLPHFLQDPGAAELFAALQALRLACPPLEIRTDYKGLVDGVEAGERAMLASATAYVELWAMIWEKLNDIGLGTDGIIITKVKAHVSPSKFDYGTIARMNAVGNGFADVQARRGAAAHPTSTWVERKRQQAAKIIGGIAGWIASLTAALQKGPRDTTVDKTCGSLDDEGRRRKARVSDAPELILIPSRPPADEYSRHRVVKLARLSVGCASAIEKEGWGCEVCGKTSGCLDRFAKQRCPGTNVIQAKSHSTHDLYGTGTLVICLKCGCYGSSRVYGLEHACAGHPGRTAKCRLRRVLAGRHPETGETIGYPVRLSSTG